MRQLVVAVVLLLPAVALGQIGPSLPGLPKPGGGAAKGFADVADLAVDVSPAKALPGEVVTVKLTITPKPDCTTYPFHPPEGQFSKNTFNPSAENPLVFVGRLVDPAGQATKKGPLGDDEQVYKKAVTWELKAVVSPKAGPTAAPILLKGFSLQACNKDNCFPFSKVSVPLEILAGDAKPVPENYQPWVEAHLSGKPKPLTGETDQASDQPVVSATGAGDRDNFFLFLLTAAGWGLISLVTPCVFPMIPITVSLFLKQSHGSTSGAVKQAGIYCLTIIVMLGVPTAFLLDRFQTLSVDPYMNVFLGGLFVFFAVSLFGAYEATIRLTFWFVSILGGGLALTSALVTESEEGRIWRWVIVGVCAAIAAVLFVTRKPGSQDGLVKFADAQRKAGGVIGTMFGAMLFSIISFTCVAPFLGAFAGFAAGGQYEPWELILAGVSFSTAFASPFFVLALFPTLIKKLPKSGGWLDVVKAVMGFVELAAAFKFARTAELRWLDPTEYFTYSVCLTAFAVISGVCGLYLLGVFRLPHDDEEKTKLSVPRLLFALAFVGFGVYLVPGLFEGADGQNQRPRGVVFAWVDSFLLPEASPPVVAVGGTATKGEATKHYRDLDATVSRIAKELTPESPPEKRLIFIDFTGVTCSNCRLNERDVFPRPEVSELLNKYTQVQLYTDTVPKELYDGPAPTRTERDAEAGRNKKYQEDTYGTAQLPLYVVLEVNPDGTTTTRGVYPEGKINDVPAFVQFLQKPLEGK